MNVKSQIIVAESDPSFELIKEGDIRRERRPLTHRVSLWLFVLVGAGLLATAVCIVMYRTGSRDDAPSYYFAIFFGLPSALLAFFACFARALDDVR